MKQPSYTLLKKQRDAVLSCLKDLLESYIELDESTSGANADWTTNSTVIIARELIREIADNEP